MNILRNLLLAFLLCFAGAAAAADAVDINTADTATLIKILKGIGPDKASAIVAYRDEHGPFKDVDQLTAVKGIGKKLLEMNRDVITIGQAETGGQ
jgi:competence protein ComEA